MWRGFEANLSFEMEMKMTTTGEELNGESGMDGVGERRVGVRDGIMNDTFIEGELGDSGCFGIRTVRMGEDCIWKLHGGV
jgi:hypothetical protein